ncbi:hypothetical protein SAVERM_959 [Streptomyces avermitilis MA-4680 = NBRC 14893]|uniref:Uncharacterized protein n=1 Tax=Streptomyces avermitilis (strain ATCC 31267 / DSM 46492 / JCM 5070 / NBRC 14893 / NCIMB 12804 / NRRL 8165 / MA-4680) TaxID=227882 RepID=Q82PG2_STRAW|nr:hypothetical protein SAVERM_959 [Streptomyces avermitilis MA-4680 = NBRC 14893]
MDHQREARQPRFGGTLKIKCSAATAPFRHDRDRPGGLLPDQSSAARTRWVPYRLVGVPRRRRPAHVLRKPAALGQRGELVVTARAVALQRFRWT